METSQGADGRRWAPLLVAGAAGAALALGAFALAESVSTPAKAQSARGVQVTAGQLLINQRISQAAVRRSNEALQLLDPIRPNANQPAKVLGWRTADLRDGSVTTPKLGDAAVTEPKIADGSVGTAKLDLGTHGVALAGVKIVNNNVASWFNRFGGAPTVTVSAAGVLVITFPGLEGRLGGNNVIHVATLRGTGAGLINARSLGGNAEVRTWNIAANGTNTAAARGFNYTVFGTTTGPAPAP